MLETTAWAAGKPPLAPSNCQAASRAVQGDSAAPRASSSQHPISLPPRLISPTPRFKFPVAQSLPLLLSGVGARGHVKALGGAEGCVEVCSPALGLYIRSAETKPTGVLRETV